MKIYDQKVHFLLVALFIIANILIPDMGDVLWTLFFFVIGSLCVWNYRVCKSVHCQITGYGSIAVGVLALSDVLGVVNIPWNVIWSLFVMVMIVGFGKELVYKIKGV